ncbi:hypothetical protein M413DRAFT_32458 [Hebeloma cylindrosporum]|uniref:Ubiquitin-like protease family profile domain-containing protein n=1 Tax=Hebeloma cylindrosporum TaxID=76867 RepID=A0A0C3BVT3_HEBCY|nr:hypothetical protein M413DRAFT_32458 [Hebeloma cylindrosporum h7]
MLLSAEPTVEATLSNLHLFPNLDTARIYFHVGGFLAADADHAAAEEREKSDLQLQEILQSESFPYRHELLVFFSLANSNFSIKHLEIEGVYLPPRMAKALTYSTSFMHFLSGLQTLEINAHPLSLTSKFPETSELYGKFWNGFGILLPLATNVTSLSLSSSYACTSGLPCETWDAMNLPHLTTLELQSFWFRDKVAFSDINTGLLGFLQRHLKSGSRLSEIAFYSFRATYISNIRWATVYDQIANLVSSNSYCALKSFKHTPSFRKSELHPVENYSFGRHTPGDGGKIEFYCSSTLRNLPQIQPSMNEPHPDPSTKMKEAPPPLANTWNTIPPRMRRTGKVNFIIPIDIEQQLLPSPEISLKALTDFSMPSQSKVSNETSLVHFFSKEVPSTISAAVTIRLRLLPTPDCSTVRQLVEFSRQAWLDGFTSIRYAHLQAGSETTTFFPFTKWLKGRDWITKQLKQNKSVERRLLAEEASILLTLLPWGVNKPDGVSEGGDPIHVLSRYLGPNWLANSEQDETLELMRAKLLEDPKTCAQFRLQNTYFTEKLLREFDSRSTYHTSKSSAWLRHLGDEVAEGNTALVTVVHLGEINNTPHWVPLVVKKGEIPGSYVTVYHIIWFNERIQCTI